MKISYDLTRPQTHVHVASSREVHEYFRGEVEDFGKVLNLCGTITLWENVSKEVEVEKRFDGDKIRGNEESEF